MILEFYTIYGSDTTYMCTSVVLFIAAMQGRQELLNVEDPHLMHVLARCLFTTVVGGKAPTTTRNYAYALNQWRRNLLR